MSRQIWSRLTTPSYLLVNVCNVLQPADIRAHTEARVYARHP